VRTWAKDGGLKCRCECGSEIPTAEALETIRKITGWQPSLVQLLEWSLGYASVTCHKRHAAMPERKVLVLQVLPGGLTQ
jgi:hypothetical protein